MRNKILRFVFCLMLVFIPVGVTTWYHLLRDVPTEYLSDVELFKYGSVGVEAANGIPYWVWYILPRLFPEKLPSGSTSYDAFGFVTEPGKEAPVGLPVKTVGFRRLGINCGLCHVGTLRTRPGAESRLLIGAPTTTLDLQRYLRFLFECAADSRFTADNIVREINRVHQLSFVETLAHSYLIITQMKKALLKQKEQVAWMDKNPDWGPGRADPFNPAKIQMLNFSFDGTIGNSDMVPLWNWTERKGFGIHWDGLNTSLREVFLNSAIGNGATNKTIHLPNLQRMQNFVMTWQPPSYPFSIDRTLTTQGVQIFRAECATCHSVGGESTGQPIQTDTDRHRLDSWTSQAVEKFHALDLYDWRYQHFRKTNGYVAVPLDGIWSRAPYLHNGSVPSLHDLLNNPAERPREFYRGYDVYDPQQVGFISNVQTAEGRQFFRFNTNLPGNSNQGHLYGTKLSAADKKALIEFLKTL